MAAAFPSALGTLQLVFQTVTYSFIQNSFHDYEDSAGLYKVLIL